VKPIRLAHCIDDLTSCGAQQVVRYLTTNLDRTRFQPVVYTFKEGPVADVIRQADVPVRLLRRKFPKFDVNLALQLHKCLKRERIEILHAHLFGATLHSMIAARGILGLSKIVTLHCDREDNVLQRLGYPFLFSAATCVIGVSQNASRIMGERYRNLQRKLLTIPNGIDLQLFNKRSPKEPIREKLNLPIKSKIIGAIGRLAIEKGYAYLLKAFAQVKKIDPEAHLIIVGEGELSLTLQTLKNTLKLNRSVHFLGSRNDVPELLQAMDVFVISSLWEGLPLVLLEAMASGVPLVATRVGGVPEVVAYGEEGLLVPPGDSDSLAQAITRVLREPSLGQQFADKALQKVRSRYSVEHMVREHERLYELVHRGQVTVLLDDQNATSRTILRVEDQEGHR